MKRGHNIVADRWTGASNPRPTHKYTQKVSKTLVFPLFDSITMTDGPTDGRTDEASYRVACPQLKMKDLRCCTLITSDAGSQYRCGRVGRGVQPPSHPRPPHTHSNTQTITIATSKMRVLTLFKSIVTDPRTNKPTDKASYTVACPQLKSPTLVQFIMINR